MLACSDALLYTRTPTLQVLYSDTSQCTSHLGNMQSKIPRYCSPESWDGQLLSPLMASSDECGHDANPIPWSEMETSAALSCGKSPPCTHSSEELALSPPAH